MVSNPKVFESTGSLGKATGPARRRGAEGGEPGHVNARFPEARGLSLPFRPMSPLMQGADQQPFKLFLRGENPSAGGCFSC